MVNDSFLDNIIKDMLALWNSDPNMKTEQLIEHLVHTMHSDLDIPMADTSGWNHRDNSVPDNSRLVLCVPPPPDLYCLGYYDTYEQKWYTHMHEPLTITHWLHIPELEE